MFDAELVDGDGEPPREVPDRNTVRIARIGVIGKDRERFGIQVRVPDDPCFGRT